MQLFNYLILKDFCITLGFNIFKESHNFKNEDHKFMNYIDFEKVKFENQSIMSALTSKRSFLGRPVVFGNLYI